MPKNNKRFASLGLVLTLATLTPLDAASRKRGRSPSHNPVAAAAGATTNDSASKPRISGKVTIGGREIELADVSQEDFLNAMKSEFSNFKAQRVGPSASSEDESEGDDASSDSDGSTAGDAATGEAAPSEEPTHSVGAALKPLGTVVGQSASESIAARVTSNRRDIGAAVGQGTVKELTRSTDTPAASSETVAPETPTHDPIPEPIAMPAGQTTVIRALGKQLGAAIGAEITAVLHEATHKPMATATPLPAHHKTAAFVPTAAASTTAPEGIPSGAGGGGSGAADKTTRRTSPAQDDARFYYNELFERRSYLVLPKEYKKDSETDGHITKLLDILHNYIFAYIGMNSLPPTEGENYVLTPDFLIRIFYGEEGTRSREISASFNANCFLLIHYIMPEAKTERIGWGVWIAKKVTSIVSDKKPALWDLMVANKLTEVFDAARKNDMQFYNDINDYPLIEDLQTLVKGNPGLKTMLNLVTALFKTAATTCAR